MFGNSFNVSNNLESSIQLLARNTDFIRDTNTALDLSLKENNVSRESINNYSCSSLNTGEDIVHSDHILRKLKSIGVQIQSVADNQAKVIYKVKQSLRKFMIYDQIPRNRLMNSLVYY